MVSELSVEFNLLIWTVALTFLQLLIATLGAISQLGLVTLAGNRQNVPSTVGWVARAQRAHRNMLESLVLFAILITAAKIMGVSNEQTILGAQLFFWARLAYAIIYILGIIWLRTAAWAVATAGLVILFIQLV